MLPHRITEKPAICLRNITRYTAIRTFNHPWESLEESKRACGLFADAGILSVTSVLMKGVNDDPENNAPAYEGLLAMRVRPYYIYMADLTKGANHSEHLSKGLEIMDNLRDIFQDFVPHFVIDAGAAAENSASSELCCFAR